MKKSIIELIGREHANTLMAGAVVKAAAENQERGLPEPVKVDGVWYRKFPNGKLEKIVMPGRVVEAKKRRVHTA
ncbi:hypothetical protein [Yersinia massiliensis]|uniref:DUF2635 domain-containing protein n=1 Tax=Yersinia massiliensis TaxID=419257 RepID=A0ABM6V1S6_9GAMM|nr:hypothetical protein [Yersinia massiliensis]AVX40740.1 hypothetical protein DA391_24010 [Yersinia massiliensis]